MMKKMLIVLLFSGVVFTTKCQIICGIDQLQEKAGSDTITTFIFSNRSLLVAAIPDVKANSNFSFKTRDLNLAWIPVNTSNIKGFVDRSIANIKPAQITDTLSCKIFGQDYTSLVIRSKRKILLFLYLDKAGQQDVFVASIANKRKLNKAAIYDDHFLIEVIKLKPIDTD